MRTALEHQSKHYPREWGGRVPKRVRLLRTVYSDVRFRAAIRNHAHDVVVNPHGAVSVLFEDGVTLGLKPDEFVILEWH